MDVRECSEEFVILPLNKSQILFCKNLAINPFQFIEVFLQNPIGNKPHRLKTPNKVNSCQA